MNINNKKLFQLHGWLGITLGLPLFVICLSGTFAVISPELDCLAHEEMRVTPPSDKAEVLSWGKLVESIKQKYPSATVGMINDSGNPNKAWQASVAFGNKDFRIVHIDPYTAKVQGQTSVFNIRSFFRIFHKQFYIINGSFWPHGRYFVCVFALVLLGCSITGILFYKRWWRSLFRLRFKPWRKFWSDLHRMIGVWALLFSLLFGITGSWYLTLQFLWDFDVLDHVPSVKVADTSLNMHSSTLPQIPLDELVAEAQNTYPELKVTGLRLNNRVGDSLTVYGESSAVLVSDFTNRINIDPFTKEVLKVQKGHELGFGSRLEESVDPLHFGRFGGWVTKSIWVVAGLAISLSILIGSIIWWLRVSRKGESGRHRSPASSYIPLICNIALMLFAIYSSYLFISKQLSGPRETKPAFKISKEKVGSWELAAYAHMESPVGNPAYYSLEFLGNIPNIKSLYAWSGNSQKPDSAKPLRGSMTRYEFPSTGIKGALHVQVEDRKGSIFDVSFPLNVSLSEADMAYTVPAPPTIPFGVKLMVTLFIFLASIPLIFWLVYIR